MQLLYDLSIRCYGVFLRLAAWFHPKARSWIEGRRDVFPFLRNRLQTGRPVIWMHVSSLGEFEQGRPLLERIREEWPRYQILLTFFSPSGYTVRSSYEGADVVSYLPLDTPGNAARFLEICRPQVAIFVKYDLWYHYLHRLKQQQVVTILISAVFRPDQIFFRWYGGLFRKMLHCFDHLFVQNQASGRLLNSLGIGPVSVSGDTRVDRVRQIAAQARHFPVVASFAAPGPTMVIGSSWPPDEALLIRFINAGTGEPWRYIIAPHDLSPAHLQQIQGALRVPSVRYSAATAANVKDKKVLIVDNVGMLSALYRYGRLAYIGGGLGKSIHNTLEPMAFGLPVIFGPRYGRFPEAVAMVARGGAFVVTSLKQLENCFAKLQEEACYRASSAIVQSYMMENQGATDKIFSYMQDTLRFAGPPK